MITRSIRAAGALALSLAVLFATTPSFAEAATSSWYQSLRYSREGRTDTATRDEAVSRRGISSATQKAIDRLDDDPVEDLPIPVLLGVPLRDIYPNFGDPRDGGARSHEGEDILAPKGNPVVSPTDAVVIRKGDGDSSGNYVYTANPGGETFVYMHLDRFSDDIKVGTVLEPGDLIGYVGDTGNAAGGPTHLHFEIHEGRDPVDPFPRLAREFTLEERVDAVTDLLKNADDEDEEAEDLVASYRSTFVAARLAGLDLPSSLEDALGVQGAAASFARDLTLGATGDDVTALQLMLISLHAGPKGTALAGAGATGYFGPLTAAALAEYQASIGIAPASGYFGPLTRARIALGA